MWVCIYISLVFIFFFKQKTAYEMRISDWSSDVCSSDLHSVPRDWNQQGWYMINNPAYADGNGAPERLVVSGAGLSLATPGGIITDTALRGTVFGPGGAVGQFDYGTVRNPWMIGGDWESTQVNSFQSLDPAENRKSLFGRLSFEVSDGLNLFVQASYAKSKNLGNLGIQLNQGNVTIQSDTDFLPQSVRDELALRSEERRVGKECVS